MAFNFAHLLSAACGGAPRRLGRLRRPWARCARLFWGGYQHRKSAFFSPSNRSSGAARRVESAAHTEEHVLQTHRQGRLVSRRAEPCS